MQTMIREVWRRVRNFFWGPRLRVRFYQEPWLFRWAIIPEWQSSEGWHFTHVGVIICFFSRRLSILWTDNN